MSQGLGRLFGDKHLGVLGKGQRLELMLTLNLLPSAQLALELVLVPVSARLGHQRKRLWNGEWSLGRLPVLDLSLVLLLTQST